LNWLHDCLEPDGVEVYINILNDYVAWYLCIGRFRSPNGWVSARSILRRCPGGTHHANATGLDGRVPADVVPDLGVVFDEILIS
jgi:hypothetical protein